MGADVKYLGSVVAALVGRHIRVITVDREGHPVRAFAAAHGEPLFEARRHWVRRVPYEYMRIPRAAAVPDLALVGRETDAVQQPGRPARVIRNRRGDDLAGLDVGDLHPP